MLIEDKFYYISLPRRGSTSFHYSCLVNNFDIKSTEEYWNIENSKVNWNDIDELDIMNTIAHGHEPIIELQKKFGNRYPIIAVHRDRHEGFYSLFKHVIFDLNRAGFTKISEHFSNLTSNTLFFWNTSDLISKKSRWECINKYLFENGLISNPAITPKELFLNSEEYVLNVIDILLTPMSFWHNHNKDIIWFDIKKLSEMEKWVQNITKKSFELKQVNSSSYIQCKLKLDNLFIENYNRIYDYYDVQKNKQTLI